jgi:glycosyltransferase involved in cell wall biosynthesis
MKISLKTLFQHWFKKYGDTKIVNKMKVSLIVPCYERPKRTIRAIECIMNQNFTDFEAYVAGDNCPFIQELVDSGRAAEYINAAKQKGIKLSIFNLPIHYGGYGYQQRNTCVKLATGEYVMFMDNDDVIDKNHIKNYYTAICNTDNDMMFFNTFIVPLDSVRQSRMEKGMIGHAEIIAKSRVLQSLQPQTNQYEHDWYYIKQMIDLGIKYEKSDAVKPSYRIMGVGELREQNID